MTKEVLIAIKGLQFGENATDEELETITSGDYYMRNGSHYIIYEEAMEGFEESTRNMIKIKPHEMILTKKGLINVQMIFEENQKNMTSYTTPYGDIMIAIDTRKVDIEEKDSQIFISVEYALEVNYEHLADCKINMHIRSKEDSGNFLQQSEEADTDENAVL